MPHLSHPVVWDGARHAFLVHHVEDESDVGTRVHGFQGKAHQRGQGAVEVGDLPAPAGEGGIVAKAGEQGLDGDHLR
jgi:hypothetical protein